MTNLSVDFSLVKSSDELQKLLKEKFAFPEFYGENWDAFRDSITGLVKLPDKLELKGIGHLERILPRDAGLLIQCLNEYNQQPDLNKIELSIFK